IRFAYKDTNGNWSILQGDWSTTEKVDDKWITLNINSSIETSSIKLIFMNSINTDTFISEMEIWGDNVPQTNENKLNKIDNLIWDIKIDRDISNLRDVFINYEIKNNNLRNYLLNINGYTMIQLLKENEDQNEWIKVREKINPSLLNTCYNKLIFKSDKESLEIRNVKLEFNYKEGLVDFNIIDDTVTEESLMTLSDTDLNTGLKTNVNYKKSIIIDMTNKHNIEYLNIYFANKTGFGCQIDYLTTTNNWSPVILESDISFNSGWNKVNIGKMNITTNKIKLTLFNNTNRVIKGELNELQVWGSKINSANEQKINIIYPRKGEFVGSQTYVKGFINGTVDDFNVADIPVQLKNGSFQFVVNVDIDTNNELNSDIIVGNHKELLEELSTKSTIDINNLTEVRKDIPLEAFNKGKVTSELLKIYLTKLPFIEITSPGDQFLTTKDTFTIKGVTDDSHYNLYINDEFVPINENSFEHMILLENGRNIIEAKVEDNNGLISRDNITIIKDDEPPQVTFDQLYDGIVVKETSINLSGEVYDYSGIKELRINNTFVNLIDNRFSYEAVLYEGNNNFVFDAVDKLGNIESFNVDIKKDTMPPETFTPVVNYKNDVPVISFSTKDEVSGISHYELKINDGRYKEVSSPYTINESLEKGSHSIFIKAIDKMGWNQEEKIEVSIKGFKDIDTNQIENKEMTVNSLTETNSSSINPYADEVNNYSPDVESYDDQGLSPYESYMNKNIEYISKPSGNLIFKTTDFTLKGRNGLDLVIGRIYDTNDAVWEDIARQDGDIDQVDKPYLSFGIGWTLNIPRIESQEDKQYVFFEDGSSYQLKWNDGNSLEHHKGHHFSGNKSKDNNGNLRIYITQKNGKVYTFNSKGQLIYITDKTGENQISFEYSDKKITRIIDTLHRVINIEYSSQNKIKKIYLDDIKCEYNYTNGQLSEFIDQESRKTNYNYHNKTVEYGARAYLRLFDNPFDIAYEIGNIKGKSLSVIKSIEFPSGSKTEYTYKIEGKSIDERDTEMGVKYLNGNPIQTQIGWWTIEKRNKTSIRVEYKREYKKESSNVYREIKFEYTPVNSPDKEWDWFYDGDWKKKGNYGEVKATKIIYPNEKKENYTFNDDKLTKEKLTYIKNSEGSLYLDKKEIMTYNNNKELTKKSIYNGKNNEKLYSLEYGYDNWGNVIYEYNSSNGLKKYMHYLNTNSTLDEFPSQYKVIYDSLPFDLKQDNYDQINDNIRNLLADSFILNKSPIEDNSIPVYSHYVYSSDGNLRAVGNWDNYNNKWITEKYEYDKNANILKKTDPIGNVTIYEYDSFYNNAYLTKTIKKGINGESIKDSDGNPIPGDNIVEQYGYYKKTGLMKWKIDGEGYLTEYEYDKLNRIKKIIYPDDNDVYNGVQIIDYKGDEYKDYFIGRDNNNPRKIHHYIDKMQTSDSDATNLTIVVNAKGSVLVEDVINDQLSSEKILTKNKYYYDSFNRLVRKEYYNKKKYYMNGQTHLTVYNDYFDYDKSDNKTNVRINNNVSTFTEYDGYGRKTKVISYPDNNSNSKSPNDSTIFTEIDYKYTKNGIEKNIIDPEKNITKKFIDWTGNLKKLKKVGKEEGPNDIIFKYNYDYLNNRVEEIDGENRITQYKYDSLGRLREKILPEDEFIKPIPSDNWDLSTDIDYTPVSYKPRYVFDYDAAGRRIAERRPNNDWNYKDNELNDNAYRYQYNSIGNLISKTDPLNNTTKYYYDKRSLKTKIIDNRDNVIENYYNSRGWLIAEVIVNGMLSNKDEATFETRKANDIISKYEYDIMGNKISETSAKGVTGIYGDGELVSFEVKEPDLYTTEYIFDNIGRKVADERLIKKEDEEGTKTIANTITHVGTRQKIGLNPKGLKTEYNINNQFLLRQKTINIENTNYYITSYEYDKVGNKTDVYDPSGKHTKYIYDEFYRMTDIINPGGQKTYGYDNVGNKTSEKDEEGNLTEYLYNSQNKISKVIDSEENITKYYYDSEGNMMKKVLPGGLTTKYIYNEVGNLVREISPEEDVIKISYDESGNIKERIDKKGQVTTYSYKRDYKIKELNYKDASDNILDTIIYTYDKNGNRIKVNSMSNKSAVGYEYDSLNRITHETRLINDRIYITGYKYDSVGNIRQIKYPESDIWLDYNYDILDRLIGLEKIADGNVQNPAFNYKKNGFLTEVKYNNNMTTVIVPDNSYRIENISVNGHSRKLLDLTYDYYKNNNVKTNREGITGTNNIYTYDN
ncbi:MAG: hypothetical protein ACOCRK_05035, partial [bacterium]